MKFKKSLATRIKSFVVESINSLAPYYVVNADFGVEHCAWSYKGALEWVRCYDSQLFGQTVILNFNGETIAHKGN